MARIERVESLIRSELADIIRKKVAKPDWGLVSIVNVKLSKDYAYAKVYYSHLGNEKQREQAERVLSKGAGFIKYELGKRIKLSTIPNLTFKFDDSLERGSEMVDKINRLSK